MEVAFCNTTDFQHALDLLCFKMVGEGDLFHHTRSKEFDTGSDEEEAISKPIGAEADYEKSNAPEDPIDTSNIATQNIEPEGMSPKKSINVSILWCESMAVLPALSLKRLA